MSSVLVRRLEDFDLPTRVEWFNNPLVYTQMVIEAPLSLAATKQWFSQNALSPSRRDYVFESVDENGTASLLAMGGFTDIVSQHRHAELYIVVRPGLTGKGIGTRAIQWLCNYGFTALGFHRIYLHTLSHNAGARKLYERLGFQHEGVLRQHLLYFGEYTDRYLHSLLHDDWKSQTWHTPNMPPLTVSWE